jgi:transglutaminase-like putative cysteine protease
MRIALAGAPRDVPSGDYQRCARAGGETVCTVRSGGSAPEDGGDAAADARHLASTLTVRARHPAIVDTARRIAGGASDARQQVRLLVQWSGENIRVSPADVWTALDVLHKREAECQGHAYLYAALARALGIPTRVVNGLAYSEDCEGFLYHSWAESLVGGRWLAVDSTFRAVPADATHVGLVEGETLAERLPLVDWIGRLRLRVLAIEHGG